MTHTLKFNQVVDYSAGQAIEVPVTLTTEGRSVYVHAKLDTGASFCIFQRAYGEQLGLDIPSGQKQEVWTAIGPFTVYGHPLKIECLDWEFETTVYFADEPGFRRDVLGRQGWLNQFRVGIVDADAMLFLSHYSA